jgi:tetratricopeptide (TPR) repeat protein
VSIEKLYAQAKSLLDSGEFKEAKELGHQLLKMRFSGAFEILAKAFHGEGELPIALRVLENGVQEAPQIWTLWLQLGNYRSESGDLVGALKAYEIARRCPGSEADQIDFNEAIMRLTFGNKEKGLEILQRVIRETDDKELRLVSLIHRLTTLIELDQVTEALMELGEAYLHEADNAELLTSLALKLLEKGDRTNALNLAKQALGLKRAGDAARVVRLIQGEVSQYSQLFEVTLRGKIEDEDNRWLHFFKTSKVYADSEEEAVQLARDFEPPDVRPHLALEKVSSPGDESGEPKGVDWSSVLDFFEPEGDD